MNRSLPMALGFLILPLAGCGGIVGLGLDLDPAEEPDTDGPTITILTPGRGDCVSRSDLGLAVSGSVTDRSRIERLEINGTEIDVEQNGQFAYTIDADLGANTLEVLAVDEHGNETNARRSYLYGDFAEDETFDLIAKVGPGGFNYAAEIVAMWAEQYMSENPELTQMSITGDDLPLCKQVDIESIKYKGIAVALEPAAGLIKVDAVIDSDPASRIDVKFKAIDCTLFHVDIPGHIYANQGELSADLSLALTDGQFSLELGEVATDLPGYDVDLEFDLFGVLGEVAQWLTEGPVQQALRNTIAGAIGPQSDEQLNSLLGEHKLFTLEDEGPDLVFGVSIGAKQISDEQPLLTPTGLALSLETRFSLVAVDAEGEVIEAFDGLSSGQRPLYVPDAEMVLHQDRDFQLAIPYGLVNSALLQVWQAGLLEQSMELGALTTYLGAELAELKEASIELETRLPPIALHNDDPQKPCALSVGDYLLHFYAAQAEDQEPTALAVYEGSFSAGLDITKRTKDESLAIGFEIAEPEMTMEIVAEQDPDVAQEFRKKMLSVVPTLAPILLGEAAVFALPNLGDQPLELESLEVLSESGYLNLLGVFPEY